MPQAHSIYINLEDDAGKIAARIQKQKNSEIVLVCPKRSFIFHDPIELKLLKKQCDILGKQVSILTMDEKGQAYAKEAGFELKSLPKKGQKTEMHDIKISRKVKKAVTPEKEEAKVVAEDKIEEPVKEEEKEVAVEKKTEKIPAPASTLSKISSKTIEEKKETPPAQKLNPAIPPPWEPWGEKTPAAVSGGMDGLVPAARAASALPRPASGGIAIGDAVTPPPMVKTENFIDWPAEQEAMLSVSKPARPSLDKKFGWKKVLVVLLLIIVAGAGVVFGVLPRAEVIVYPKTETMAPREWEINISTKTQKPDNDKLALPAFLVTQEASAEADFQSQGKKEVGNKASGKVRVLNLTKAPLNLKASTTVLNLNGKNYVLLDDIVGLKPTLYKNAATKEIDESSLSPAVTVVAAVGGEGYNVPAGTRLEVTNQVFGSRPQVLYARTETAITGGTSRYISLVSQQDITAAQNSLAASALGNVRQELAKKGQVLEEKAYILEPIKFTTDKQINTESPNFSGQIQIKVSGLAYDKNQLRDMVKQRIARTLTSNKRLSGDLDAQMQIKIKNFDLAGQQAVLSVHFEGQTVYNLDLDNLPDELKAKSKFQVMDILSQRPEIEKIDITLSPQWQSVFPWFSSKIEVKEAPSAGQ